MKPKNHKKEYAIYKGDEILAVGTIEEIAKELNILPSTVIYYGMNCYKKKIANRKSINARELVELED